MALAEKAAPAAGISCALTSGCTVLSLAPRECLINGAALLQLPDVLKSYELCAQKLFGRELVTGVCLEHLFYAATNRPERCAGTRAGCRSSR
jgi:hypothetical protein